MALKLDVTKAHGAGNDFLLIEDIENAIELDAAVVVKLCERRRGVGADGLIRVGRAKSGRLFMDLRNADGSMAEVSGNGLACLAKFCFDRGLLAGAEATVETTAGLRGLAVQRDADGKVSRVSLDMGPASFSPDSVPVKAAVDEDHVIVVLDGEVRPFYFAGMGNPHAVCFVEDLPSIPVPQWGVTVERDPRFWRGTNVEFAHVESADTISVRIWERGVGETLACGTGACAVAAVANRLGFVGDMVNVRVPGGLLHVTLGGLPKNSVRLTGSAKEVFTATVDTDLL